MKERLYHCGNFNCPVRRYISEGELKDDDYFVNLHLDEGIKNIVITLIKNGVETYQSCEGGRGHAYPWPTVEFRGSSAEGLRALSVAITYGFPVQQLQQVWDIEDGRISDTCWILTFWPPKGSQIWEDRDTTARYAAMKTISQTDN